MQRRCEFIGSAGQVKFRLQPRAETCLEKFERPFDVGSLGASDSRGSGISRHDEECFFYGAQPVATTDSIGVLLYVGTQTMHPEGSCRLPSNMRGSSEPGT